jgi:hypothetical protein
MKAAPAFLAALALSVPLAAAEASLNRTALNPIEHELDNRILRVTADDPAEILGGTRGLYLPGYGAVFTTDVSLIITPGLSPFRQQTPELVKRIHDRKIKRVMLLKQAVTEMAVAAAKALQSMPVNEQVVLAVRVSYLPWEDTSGLPSQLVVQADRGTLLKKADIDSAIRTEEH